LIGAKQDHPTALYQRPEAFDGVGVNGAGPRKIAVGFDDRDDYCRRGGQLAVQARRWLRGLHGRPRLSLPAPSGGLDNRDGRRRRMVLERSADF
jgi:hypothetical protein